MHQARLIRCAPRDFVPNPRENFGLSLKQVFPLPKSSSFDDLLQAIDDAKEDAADEDQGTGAA